MQRLFSMFPTGPVGVALLLMRISLAAMLFENGFPYAGNIGPKWALAGFLVIAMALSLGFWTPIACGLSGLVEVAVFLMSRGPSPFYLLVLILNAGVLAVLGPGAYSLDGRMYGRRRLILPRDEDRA
jgi:uncharacterized membrane protein YphA (DoxX/SURF4 family)